MSATVAHTCATVASNATHEKFMVPLWISWFSTEALKSPLRDLECIDASPQCIVAGLMDIVAPLESLKIASKRALEASMFS